MANRTGKTKSTGGKRARRKRRDRLFRKRSSALLIRVGREHGIHGLDALAACLGISLRALRDWRAGRAPIDAETIWNCEPVRADFFVRLGELAKGWS